MRSRSAAYDTAPCASRYAILAPRTAAWRSKQDVNWRDQFGVQHRYTMLKPPLMLKICPVIQPARGEASSATAGAMSSGMPSRRTG